jgi:hypothetical protein
MVVRPALESTKVKLGYSPPPTLLISRHWQLLSTQRRLSSADVRYLRLLFNNNLTECTNTHGCTGCNANAPSQCTSCKSTYALSGTSCGKSHLFPIQIIPVLKSRSDRKISLVGSAIKTRMEVTANVSHGKFKGFSPALVLISDYYRSGFHCQECALYYSQVWGPAQYDYWCDGGLDGYYWSCRKKFISISPEKISNKNVALLRP